MYSVLDTKHGSNLRIVTFGMSLKHVVNITSTNTVTISILN